MGLVADRVKDTTITTGTGAYNFVGVAPTGYRTFNSVFSNGNLVEYAVTDGTNWEVGVGAYGFSTGVGFINRTTILASSNAGAAVSWGAGTKEIWCNASAKFLSTPNFRKNAIIGGDFATNPWRRGTFFLAFPGGLTADGWTFGHSSAAVWNVTKSATGPLFSSAGRMLTQSLRIACTTIDSSISSSDYALLTHEIVGSDFAPFAQQPLVLSFWHQHAKAGIYCVHLGNGVDKSYIAEYTQTIAGTWQFQSIAIPATPSAGSWNYSNGLGCRIVFSLICGSSYQSTANSWLSAGNALATSNQVNTADTVSNDFALAAVQLEVGLVATAFDARPTQEVLMLSGSTPLSGRNIIIGGDFGTNPWQRGTSFVSHPGSYTADMWQYFKTGSHVVDISKVADGPSVSQCGRLVTHSLLIDVQTAQTTIGAGDYSMIGANIEGYNFMPLAQIPMTLSFWHKHTKTGTYCVGLWNASNAVCITREYTQATSDMWELATLTFAPSPTGASWNYTNGIGLRVLFAVACGSTYFASANNVWQSSCIITTANQVNGVDSTSNNFRLALVQLEAGSLATPFETRSEQEELQRCLRNYWEWRSVGGSILLTAQAYGTGTCTGVLYWPVVMRVAPTVAMSAVTDFATLRFNASGSDLLSAMVAGGANASCVNMTFTSANLVAGNAVRVDASSAARVFVSADF